MIRVLFAIVLILASVAAWAQAGFLLSGPPQVGGAACGAGQLSFNVACNAVFYTIGVN